MKKIFIFIIVAALFTGCNNTDIFPTRTEIKDLAILQTVAIDKGSKNNIKLTILERDIEDLQANEKSGEGGGGESSEGQGVGQGEGAKKRISIEAEDLTFSGAMQKLQGFVDKTLFWGHVDYVFIGEEAAKESLSKYLDYITRDNYIRQSTLIYVVKGSAGEMFKKSGELGYFLPDYITTFRENKRLKSDTSDFSLYNFIQKSYTPHSVIVIQCFDVLEDNNQLTSRIDGYAVFKDMKLTGMIENKAAKGFNMLSNSFTGDIFEITNIEGNNMSLEVMNLNTKIKPVVKDKKVTGFKIDCDVESNVKEDYSDTDYNDEKTMEFLEEEQNKLVKEMIEECLKLSQIQNTDFLNLWEHVYSSHPIIWNHIQKDWEKNYQSLQFEINVTSRIARTYIIREGAGKK